MTYQSSATLANWICVTSIFSFIFFMIRIMQKGELTRENVIVFIIYLTSLFFLLTFQNTMKIKINENEVIYQTLFEKKKIKRNEIKEVKITYYHQNVRTIFPILHIQTRNNESLEIPSMMFEEELDDILKELKKSQLGSL